MIALHASPYKTDRHGERQARTFRGQGLRRERPRQRGRQVPRDARRTASSGRWPGHPQPRLVAGQPEPLHPAPAPAGVRPHGPRLRLRRGVQEAGLPGPEEGPDRPDDRLAGLVAGGLRSLRRPHDPHGLARRGHLPHRRRPRGRRHRQPALRTHQQLAGQRQPGQGPPPAVAHQAEVRQQHQLGRPLHPGRQRGPGEHGLQDLRLRWRPGGHLGP